MQPVKRNRRAGQEAGDPGVRHSVWAAVVAGGGIALGLLAFANGSERELTSEAPRSSSPVASGVAASRSDGFVSSLWNWRRSSPSVSAGPPPATTPRRRASREAGVVNAARERLPITPQEFEASDWALRANLVDDERLRAETQKIRPLPGEVPRELEQRRDDAAARYRANQVLIEYELDGIYQSSEYPYGYPIALTEESVRASVEAFSPQQRVEFLDAVLRSGWQPHKAVPNIAEPESGYVYPGVALPSAGR
jgi:hypothetical protein